MFAAVDVARYLCKLAAQDPEGEQLTPMRLHKLLYYCQGWYLAWFDRALFLDRIEAWQHGPVTRSVYAAPWSRGSGPVVIPPGGQELDEETRRAIEQVWNYYGQYTASGLRALTHREAPWLDHFRPDQNQRCTNETPIADMSDYFGSLYRRETGDDPGSEADRGGTTLSHADLLRRFA
jgi:uncharacterized phage-associated protein